VAHEFLDRADVDARHREPRGERVAEIVPREVDDPSAPEGRPEDGLMKFCESSAVSPVSLGNTKKCEPISPGMRRSCPGALGRFGVRAADNGCRATRVLKRHDRDRNLEQLAAVRKARATSSSTCSSSTGRGSRPQHSTAQLHEAQDDRDAGRLWLIEARRPRGPATVNPCPRSFQTFSCASRSRASSVRRERKRHSCGRARQMRPQADGGAMATSSSPHAHAHARLRARRRRGR
jgi:hypothetical protein